MEFLVFALLSGLQGSLSKLAIDRLRKDLASFWERAPAAAVTDLEATALRGRAVRLGMVDDAKLLMQYIKGEGGFAWMKGA